MQIGGQYCCRGDPSGAALDTGVFASTPIQREHLVALTSNHGGRLLITNCRQLGLYESYGHNLTRFEVRD